MNTLTIFTPTYNREYTLDTLYQSLCRQTSRDFIWLVVDDGSVDNTEELIDGYIKENKIQINYIKQPNGGKHVALMNGIKNANTELFFCVDSDDSLTDDAVEIIVKNNDIYREEAILGFYYRQVHKDGSLHASLYPAGVERVGITELYYKYNFEGDTAIVLKTALIKPYTIPVFENEKFVSERSFYCRINHLGEMVLREERIYIAEYLQDGYTKNFEKLIYKNPYGRALGCLDEVTYSSDFVYKVKQYAQYRGIAQAFHLNRSKLKVYDKSNILHRILCIPFISHYKKMYSTIRKKGESSQS